METKSRFSGSKLWVVQPHLLVLTHRSIKPFWSHPTQGSKLDMTKKKGERSSKATLPTCPLMGNLGLSLNNKNMTGSHSTAWPSNNLTVPSTNLPDNLFWGPWWQTQLAVPGSFGEKLFKQTSFMVESTLNMVIPMPLSWFQMSLLCCSYVLCEGKREAQVLNCD